VGVEDAIGATLYLVEGRKEGEVGTCCTEEKAENKKKEKWRQEGCAVCCVLCTYVNRREQDIELWLHHPLTAPKNGGPTEYVMGAALGQPDKLFAAMDQISKKTPNPKFRLFLPIDQ
jgi:hypothetical protein